MSRTALLVSVLSLISIPVYAQSAGDVVISEIMPDPENALDGDGEYVELYNATSSDLNLQGWSLVVDGTGNDENDQLDDVTIPSEGFVVLCVNDDATANGGLDNCAFDYVNEISLNNNGSSVVLKNASGTEVDRVEYDDGTNWPVTSGASMEYISQPSADNNNAANWQEATTQKGDFANDANADEGSPNANATGGALPVELASFDVSTDGQRGVLTWQTASETNNAGFAVQHQSPASSDWRKLGYREGEGTTTQPRSYRFTTDRLGSGTHTFRLKQVDTDGTAHFSAPKTVAVRGDAGLTLLSGHPVVRGQSAVLSIEVPTRQSVTVMLYDVLGQQVRTVTSGKMAPGQPMRATVSTADLSSGIYFLRAQGPSFQRTKKLTVVQ